MAAGASSHVRGLRWNRQSETGGVADQLAEKPLVRRLPRFIFLGAGRLRLRADAIDHRVEAIAALGGEVCP